MTHHDSHVTDATPEQVRAWFEAGEILLVDVREVNEYAVERIHGALLYPFFLENVLGGADDLTMDDGLHPTEKGVAEIVRNILPQAEALVKRIDARKATSAKN